jgi:hypothetical protein
MHNKATRLVAPATGWRRFRALIGLMLVALAGCFGAPAMRYDIQEYNKQTVMSEQKMLLFNIGRLNQDLPPHFMMLATVSQSRTFTGTAGFNWANPATWSVPFAATNTESPTIQFVPIQGQDFANRFEAPLTDKFTLFLEDREWFATDAEKEAILLLFAQSLYLAHGDHDRCEHGLYVNRVHDPQDRGETQYYNRLSACVAEIVYSYSDYVQIDGSHPVPTIDSIAPAGADIVTALGAGYKWTGGDGNYQLTTPIRIPAWFDYNPKFAAPAKPSPTESEPVPPVFTLQAHPNWAKLTYFYLPSNYKAKVYRVSIDPGSPIQRVNVLVPDGYRLARDQNGVLRTSSHGEYVAEKLPAVAHTANGRRTRGSRIITDITGFRAQDIGSKIAGPGIPSGTLVAAIEAYAGTATMSDQANLDSHAPMSIGDGENLSDRDRFSYSDEVVSEVWPVTQNYFYIELRKNDHRMPGHLIADETAERDCYSSPDDDPDNGVVCGYFKIGNLLQIMHRLAKMACTSTDQGDPSCSASNFGIGYHVPSWADTSASFLDTDGVEKYVWVPAHNPVRQYDLAQRDRRAFFTLYKLYQMSLVNTSQLVSGAPAITIPAGK